MKRLLKNKDGRLNMLPIFGGIILLFGALILAIWLPERDLHSRLRRQGKDVVAEIRHVTYYDHPPKRAPERTTNDINDADSIELVVRFMAEGQAYVTTLRTTFSLERNDHASLQDAIAQGKVSVRYLPSDPSKARFTVEFTDPDNNPYFGGK